MRACKVRTRHYVVGQRDPEIIFKDATFHQWGLALIEGDNGFANFTMGIVEFTDGTCGKVDVEDIAFTEENIPVYRLREGD